MKKKLVSLNNSKVMLICTTDNMIWQFLLPHIEDLKKYGAEVDCICSKTGFWFDELRDKFGLNMIEVSMERSPLKIKNWKAYKTLKRLQKQNNYNLIYCQQPVGGLLGRLIGKKFKIPVIYTAHGFFFFKGNSKIKNFIFKNAEKYLAKYTDALITMNNEDFSACQNWKCKNVFKINGIGIDEIKYDNSKFDKKEFKRSLGLEDDDKIILSVSEFIKRKNYPTMLRSFAKLCEKEQNVKYVLCGTGILFDEMKQYAKELGIENDVLFLGYRKDINKIMQISDVFFHESFQEGLTMSIMEAMHFKLPVVTSAVRGNEDLIDNEKGGYITGCLDEDLQVECLIKILNNKELAKKMGDYNHNKIKDYYLDTVRSQLKDIYQKIGILEEKREEEIYDT